MMRNDHSVKARERHVEVYVAALRESLTDSGTQSFDDEVIDTLAMMYRSGWDDADMMFRTWEGRQ